MLFRQRRTNPTDGPSIKFGPTSESPGYFSTGIAELDFLLGGGLKAGTVAVAVGDATVSNEDFLLLGLSVVMNFLALGRGALIVPPSGVPAEQIRDRVAKYVPVQTFDTKARVIDYTSAQAAGDWIVPMGRYGRDGSIRAMVDAERAVSGNPRAPFVEVSALDTYENMVGRDVAVRMFANGITRTKAVGGVSLIWVRSTSAGRDAIEGMADYYLTLTRNAGGLLVGGTRPAIVPRSIQWTETRDALRISLGLPVG